MVSLFFSKNDEPSEISSNCCKISFTPITDTINIIMHYSSTHRMPDWGSEKVGTFCQSGSICSTVINRKCSNVEWKWWRRNSEKDFGRTEFQSSVLWWNSLFEDTCQCSGTSWQLLINWCQFHQLFTCSFYARRSLKCKKHCQLDCLFLRIRDLWA